MERMFIELKEKCISDSRISLSSFEAIVEIIGKTLEEYKNKYVSIGAYKQVAWERDIAIEQLHELGYEFGEKIDKEEFCEWKYNKGFIVNPHTRRMFSAESSMQNNYCNTCGKKIKVV